MFLDQFFLYCFLLYAATGHSILQKNSSNENKNAVHLLCQKINASSLIHLIRISWLYKQTYAFSSLANAIFQSKLQISNNLSYTILIKNFFLKKRDITFYVCV